ncbi:outer membrane beta-barrel protein [Tardiphaga sp.]|uniref:outer membrane protein n=1 Tax=Tardiphaga sp. TaxID=1926292 RepID=UPI00261D4F93|nr:outer membrane beta-barrel protein [Tardiphaga sp.]MDB5616114.1 putative outer membrane protein [Tardiphaga sp.]
MKKLFLTAAALAALGTSASAADLAARPYTKAPAFVAAVYDWSGFYIGANGGWGSQRDCRTNVTTAFNIGCHDADGAVAGGQIGYRWQSSSWVFGFEAQGDWADLSGSAINNTGLNNVRSKTDAFGLFTAQAGWAWNNTLLYVKGGAAVVSNRFEFRGLGSNVLLSSSDDSSRWGGTAGVGLEYGFAPNWSVAVEYDHVFLDRHDMTFTSAATGLPLAATYRSGGDLDLVTARINYRWGAQVIPKY